MVTAEPQPRLDSLERRASRLASRAASLVPDGLAARTSQRASGATIGVRRLREALADEAALLDGTGVRDLVRSAGGHAAAVALASAASAGRERVRQLEEECASLRQRCSEAERALLDEKHQRVEACEQQRRGAAAQLSESAAAHARRECEWREELTAARAEAVAASARVSELSRLLLQASRASSAALAAVDQAVQEKNKPRLNEQPAATARGLDRDARARLHVVVTQLAALKGLAGEARADIQSLQATHARECEALKAEVASTVTGQDGQRLRLVRLLIAAARSEDRDVLQQEIATQPNRRAPC